MARFGQPPRQRRQRHTSPRSADAHDADRRRRHPARQRKNRVAYRTLVQLLRPLAGLSSSVVSVGFAPPINPPPNWPSKDWTSPSPLSPIGTQVLTIDWTMSEIGRAHV